MAMEYRDDLVVVGLNNGYEYVVKLDDAIALMKILTNAPKFDDRWVSTGGGRTCHIGGGEVAVNIRSLPQEKFVEGILNGPFVPEEGRLASWRG